MIENPCKGCKDRTVEPNCHMECSKYLEWFVMKDEIKQKKEAIKRVDGYFAKRKKGRFK